MNLGDEIGIAAPPSYANDTAFEEYCKQHAISLDMLGCDDTNCEQLACQGALCHVVSPRLSGAWACSYHLMMRY